MERLKQDDGLTDTTLNVPPRCVGGRPLFELHVDKDGSSSAMSYTADILKMYLSLPFS